MKTEYTEDMYELLAEAVKYGLFKTGTPIRLKAEKLIKEIDSKLTRRVE